MIGNRAPSSIPDFNRIYILAKARDRDELRNYADNIDILDETGFYTPAGKLAAEGDSDSAEFLRYHTGANVDDIARCSARAGLIEYTEQLRKHYSAEVAQIQRGAAAGMQVDYLEKLSEKKGEYTYEVAEGFMDGGHFADEESALRTMTLNCYLFWSTELLNSLSYLSGLENIHPLKKRASSMRDKMMFRKFSYEESLAFTEKNIIFWLFQCDQLIKQKKLSQTMLLTIATFLCPVGFKTMLELRNKLILHFNKRFIINDLEAYQRLSSYGTFFNQHKESLSLLAECKETATKDQLTSCVEKSKKRKRANENNDLLDTIIVKYQNRLS